jgi:hypothetical protein
MFKRLALSTLGLLASISLANAAAIPLYSPSFSNGILDVTILNQTITAVNNLTGQGTPQNITGAQITSLYTASVAAPGTQRADYGKVTTAATANLNGSTTNNLVGVRGEFNLPSGATVNNYNDYLYGVQGKDVLPGTVDAANICGLCGQWDISATTFASSGTSISVAWLDAGATSSSSANSNLATNDSSILRMTNTTSAATASIVEIVAQATDFMQISTNGGTPNFFVAGGTGNNSCAKTGGAICSKALLITVGGTNYWIPLFSSNS